MWSAIAGLFVEPTWWFMLWVIVTGIIWALIIISIIVYVCEGETISPTDARQMLAGIAVAPFWPLVVAGVILWAPLKLVSIALTKEF